MNEVFNPAIWWQAPNGDWIAVIAGSPDYDPAPLELSPVTLGGSRYMVRRVVTGPALAGAVNELQPGMFGLLVGDPVVT